MNFYKQANKHNYEKSDQKKGSKIECKTSSMLC